MAWSPQNFIDKVGPAIAAAWLNGVDVFWGVFGGAQTQAQAQTALFNGAPLSSGNGGTGTTGLTGVLFGNTGGATTVATAPQLFTALSLTQAQVGTLLYPTTASETAASVTPTNFAYPELNVLRYGADASGATDSTAAFNRALSVALKKAVWALHTGLTFNARVYIPTGWYLLGSTGTFISYGAFPVLWVGDGPQASMLINGSTNQPIFNVNGGAGQFYGGFDSLGFGQQSGVTAVAGNSAITMTNYTEFFIRNIGIFNFPNPFFDGIVMNNSQQYKVSDVEVQGTLNFNIHLKQGGYGVWTNVQSDDAGANGWLLDNQVKLYLVNCAAFATVGGDGWSLNSTNPATNPNLNNEFVNCMSDTSFGHNWNIGDSVFCTWTNCWGSSQKAGALATKCGFLINTANTHDCVFTACSATNNNQDGFQLASSPTKLSFVNCMAGQSGFGNGVGAGGGYGFNINNGAATIRILGGQNQSNVTGAFNFNGGNRYANDILVRDMANFSTCNTNTSSVTIGNSTVVVNHGLALSPDNVLVTPTSSLASSGITSYFVSAFTATTFTLTTNANVAGANFTFNWRATLVES